MGLARRLRVGSGVRRLHLPVASRAVPAVVYVLLVGTWSACEADLEEHCIGGACCVDVECPTQSEGEHEHEGMPSGAQCSPGSTATYENFGKAFMASYCLGCHSAELTGDARLGAPPGRDFDTLEQIRADADMIDEHAAAGPGMVNTEMPPAGGPAPTDPERERLGEWLACGAPSGGGVTQGLRAGR